MRKTALAVTLFLVLLLSVAEACSVKLAQADPYMYYKIVSPPAGSSPLVTSISSPNNNTIYRTNNITLTFNINTQNTSMKYLLGAYFKADWMQDNVTVYKQNTYSPEFPESWDYNKNLGNISNGEHNIVITAWGGGFYAEGLTAYNFDMTTISVINFTIDAPPPKVSILSPENKTYDSSDVALNFTINEKASLIRYSLDGQENSTLMENTTLTGLPNGIHNLKVYAWDDAGNLGVSGTVVFEIAKPEAFPITLVVAVAGTSAVVLACVGIILYLRKTKH
jgi:hypothetical protein